MPQPTHIAHSSADQSKTGLGKVLAIIILPLLVVVLMSVAFFVIPMLQSNNEDGRQPIGGAHVHDPTNR